PLRVHPRVHPPRTDQLSNQRELFRDSHVHRRAILQGVLSTGLGGDSAATVEMEVHTAGKETRGVKQEKTSFKRVISQEVISVTGGQGEFREPAKHSPIPLEEAGLTAQNHVTYSRASFINRVREFLPCS